MPNTKPPANPQAAPDTTKELDTDLPRIGIKHFSVRVASIVEAKNMLIEKGLIDDTKITRGRTGIDYFFIRGFIFKWSCFLYLYLC